MGAGIAKTVYLSGSGASFREDCIRGAPWAVQGVYRRRIAFIRADTLYAGSGFLSADLRYYYQAGALDQLIDDVLDTREERRQNLNEYDALIRKKVKENEETRGFWSKAYCVNEYLRRRSQKNSHPRKKTA